jgi:glycosyltransferase involved in cell wall biosynthesis
VDVRFYRAAYNDSDDLTDTELEANAEAGRLPAGRPLNPTEFVRRAVANGLLSSDFDPIGYRVHHPELWGPDRQDWEAAIHFLKAGRSPDERWERPFDANFYRELYSASAGSKDSDRLREQWLANPQTYGSLEESLVRNGWASRAWVVAFDHQSYTVYNSLTEQLRTPIQALGHFVQRGWRELLAVSVDREFDLTYYADIAGGSLSTPPAEAYRIWIEQGLVGGAPANEAGHLRALGLDLSRYPEGFNWRLYLEEHPDASSFSGASGRPAGRWDALHHLVETGVLTGGSPLPVRADALSVVLLAAADRFAVANRQEEAARTYERGLLRPDPPVRLVRHAADQALRLGHHARALSLYRHVRSGSALGLWTWCNGAKAAVAVGALDEAAEWVLAGLAEYPRNVPLQEVLLQIQHARYSQAISRHLGALRAGTAETELGAALDAILDLFLAGYRASFGATARSPRKRQEGPLRVAILANKDLPQCTFYRVDLKAHQLDAATGVDLQVFERADDEAFRSAAATADVAVFYRLASGVELLRNIAACRAMGVPTVYEIDDLVFDRSAFPEPLDAYDNAITANEHFGLRAGVALVRHAIALCDAAIASTDHLAKQMRGLVRSGIALVHRNSLSKSLVAIAKTSVPRPPLPAGAPLTLFYGTGTRAHGADFRDLLAPALTRLMAERPEVRLVVCGYLDATGLAAKFPGRVDHVALVEDRDAYLSQFLGVDVNLAVLRPGTFNDCKSEIKWLEAAAFCVPSVVSDVMGYRETLRDGVDVVRVPPDPAAWYTALRSMVLDPPRRAAIGAAARERALELYDPAKLGHRLIEGLRALTFPPASMSESPPTLPADTAQLAVRSPPATVPAQVRLPRVLLTNVFFPPQAIGGATRVLRDQAAELLARYADRYEIGILCGNHESATPYRTESYDWRGAPVWSIGCPQREHMDWIAFDPRMAAPVDAVLDRFKPSLVHAHCIQRLTATALERVAARHLPYIVTAHDAWWVSDHQFLMDGQNRLRMPWDTEEFASDQNPHTRADSWSRRLRLNRVLNDAAAVLTVSQSFASLYRRAGVAKVEAVPNGLPELPPLEPAPSVPGRVRLGHVGGAMAHKGYFLLRQALAHGNFGNLDLLVIDHRVPSGEERQERWGATPVRVIGRMPQARVGALYGQIDVLCAPSLWPESFGLVTREALHYGKWVVASSRGAIGEDVVPDKNGWVVDVADPAALPRILAEIHNDPERFSQSLAERTKGRTVAQQVAEVVNVYDRVLAAGSMTVATQREVPSHAASGNGAVHEAAAPVANLRQPPRRKLSAAPRSAPVRRAAAALAD